MIQSGLKHSSEIHAEQESARNPCTPILLFCRTDWMPLSGDGYHFWVRIPNSYSWTCFAFEKTIPIGRFQFSGWAALLCLPKFTVCLSRFGKTNEIIRIGRSCKRTPAPFNWAGILLPVTKSVRYAAFVRVFTAANAAPATTSARRSLDLLRLKWRETPFFSASHEPLVF